MKRKKTMIDSEISVEKAAELLKSGKKILIFVHSHPDGDTLGSALALKEALCEKEVVIACTTAVSDRLSFLLEGETQLVIPENFEPDTVVSVDVAELNMLGDYEQAYGDRIDLKIDHHKTGELFAKHNLVNANSAACAEIIYEIISEMNALNDKTAYYLYVGISTDTGCFRYGNTTPKTHAIASKLTRFDFNAGKLNSRLFDSKSKGEITAMKLALNTMHFYCGGKTAIVSFTNEMKEKNSITDDDLQIIKSLPREIEGVLLGITVKEKTGENGTFKVSMRTGGEIDASALCSLFGGGGHMGAAGCELTADSAEEVEKMLMDAIKDYLK